ncbi:MAG TPA: hypothetical protein VNV18_03650 [Stellaceae bacterium]|jgi:hypothetical protein|nr:hypothetical protein [Stellaceae bacterium]
MKRAAAYDRRGAEDRPRSGVGPVIVAAAARAEASRLSPLASSIVVTLLSLAIWAALWAVVSSLLRG